ncbi:MAG TPA: STAS domain-containing protein [Spirillospora sp.]
MSLGAEGPVGAVPPEPLRVRSRVLGSCLVVEAEGELTILTSDLLRDHVLADMRELDGPPRVVMDVGGVDFCDSSGLNALIVLWKHAHRAGGEFVLARPERRFRTIIERSGLDRHLIAHPTQEQAVAAVSCGN